MNRWKIEEVEYINIAYRIPYEIAESYMEDLYGKSINNIRLFMTRIKDFSAVLERA